MPAGHAGPERSADPRLRIVLFGKAGDRVKAAWFTPPSGQPAPPVVFLTPETILTCRQDLRRRRRQPLVHSDTLFCSGHSFTADGDLFIAGGTELYSISNPDGTATDRTARDLAPR